MSQAQRQILDTLYTRQHWVRPYHSAAALPWFVTVPEITTGSPAVKVRLLGLMLMLAIRSGVQNRSTIGRKTVNVWRSTVTLTMILSVSAPSET